MAKKTTTSIQPFLDKCQYVIDLSKQLGASQTDVFFRKQEGLTTQVRMRELETLEYHQDASMSVTVYFGHKKGSASSTDLTPSAMKASVEAACSIAKVTQNDDASGLPDLEDMAWEYPNLDLYHPIEISADKAIHLSLACEAAGLDYDSNIHNSNGASLTTNEAISVLANSHGFSAWVPSTSFELSCGLLAKKEEEMQQDFYYTRSRDFKALETPDVVGKETAKRTVSRLGAQKIETQTLPIILCPEMAKSLLGHFFSAIGGGSIYRKSSFLCDHLEQPIFPSHFTFTENPLLPKACGSYPFDGEGVQTKIKDIVKEGILKTYLLNTYFARKLGYHTTGNAGGIYNILLPPSLDDLPALLKKMHRGILVTHLMGQGVNLVTGEYSRGAAGFMIENGIIAYPVDEITIAGNLKEIYKHILAHGNDIDKRGNIQCGSLLLKEMVVSGQQSSNA